MDPRFIRFLEYLTYWRRQEYARAVRYPHALHFLKLLQSERFRQFVARQDVTDWLAFQQYHHWLFYRQRLLDKSSQPAPYTLPLDGEQEQEQEQAN